jgi:hypothetical protein
MDRDAHMDCQWVCGVYSQLEWFSNAPNALVIAVVALFASSAVQRECMHFPRFPWSPHMYLPCARFRCGVCVSNAVPGERACKMHAKSREKVGGIGGVQCSTRSECAHFFFPMGIEYEEDHMENEEDHMENEADALANGLDEALLDEGSDDMGEEEDYTKDDEEDGIEYEEDHAENDADALANDLDEALSDEGSDDMSEEEDYTEDDEEDGIEYEEDHVENEEDHMENEGRRPCK